MDKQKFMNIVSIFQYILGAFIVSMIVFLFILLREYRFYFILGFGFAIYGNLLIMELIERGYHE